MAALPEGGRRVSKTYARSKQGEGVSSKSKQLIELHLFHCQEFVKRPVKRAGPSQWTFAIYNCFLGI